MDEVVKRKVLYVDDERENLDSFWRKFRKEYNVLRASSGKEGLDILKENKDIPVVITDQKMPEMTGIEFLEKTMGDYPEIIRMILTGYTDVEDLIDAINMGKIYRYITKPWDEQEMRMTINNAIEAYDLRVKNRVLVEDIKRKNIELEEKVKERTSKLADLNKNLEKRVEEQVRELERAGRLKRYLSPKLAERLLTDGFSEKIKRKRLTIFFTDIRGFTDVSEVSEPEELIELLNEYLSRMTEIVYKYEGTLNKFMGDGIMGFFGDPIDCDDHAERTIKMSLDMKLKMNELKEKWALGIGGNIDIGIGINTGYVTVGTIGSEAHMDYTVIGGQVNLAARLEKMAKPGQILISYRTYELVRNIVDTEEIGEIEVKGIHRPVMVYNVLSLKS